MELAVEVEAQVNGETKISPSLLLMMLAAGKQVFSIVKVKFYRGTVVSRRFLCVEKA